MDHVIFEHWQILSQCFSLSFKQEVTDFLGNGQVWTLLCTSVVAV